MAARNKVLKIRLAVLSLYPSSNPPVLAANVAQQPDVFNWQRFLEDACLVVQEICVLLLDVGPFMHGALPFAARAASAFVLSKVSVGGLPCANQARCLDPQNLPEQCSLLGSFPLLTRSL